MKEGITPEKTPDYPISRNISYGIPYSRRTPAVLPSLPISQTVSAKSPSQDRKNASVPDFAQKSPAHASFLNPQKAWREGILHKERDPALFVQTGRSFGRYPNKSR
jgi:hypothetical protein